MKHVDILLEVQKVQKSVKKIKMVEQCYNQDVLHGTVKKIKIYERTRSKKSIK